MHTRIEDKKLIPLSEGQAGLWALQKSAPNSSAYNLPICFSIKGLLEQKDFIKVSLRLLREHPILGAQIVSVDGHPFLYPVSEPLFENLEQDATGLSDADLVEQLRAFLKEPFEIENSLLIRLRVYRRSADEVVVLYVLHHILFDGASIAAFIKTFVSSLGSEVEVETVDRWAMLEEFPKLEKKMLTSQEGETHLQYWKEVLSGELPVLELPLDFPRPAERSFAGKTFRYCLKRDISEAIDILTKHSYLNPSTIFLTLFKTLLHRYTKQEDIIIGIPVMTRWGTEFTDRIGYFINMIALRTQLQEEQPFVDLANTVQLSLLDGLDHADYPFPALVRNLGVGRDLSQSPIFQVGYYYQNYLQPSEINLIGDLTKKDLQVEFLDLVHQEGEYDLALEVYRQDSEFLLSLKYNPELFTDSRIELMIGHLVELTKDVAKNPSRPLKDYDLITRQEKDTLALWNSKQKDYPSTKLVHDLISEQAAKTADKIAVSFNSERMTYRELEERSNSLAAYLRSLGVVRGSRVAICVERSTHMVVGMLAVMRAGAAYVPLDPEYPSERLDYMMADAEVSAVIAQKSTEHVLFADSQQTIPVVLIDQDWSKISVCSLSNEEIADSSKAKLAYVIYTSGSTGKPKGVMIGHQALCNFLYSMSVEPGFTSEDRILAVTTYCFDIAVLELLLPLLQGGESVICASEKAKNPDLLRLEIERVRPTIMQATPATWTVLFHSGWRNERKIKILCGGEALPTQLKDLLVADGGEVWNMFGPTETTVWSTVSRVFPNKPVTIGYPIANTEIHIVDKNMNLVPIGVAGELCIAGDGLAEGYWKRPELTKEKFVDNPFKLGTLLYRTGDLARWREDGEIDFLGRLDHQVKIRGFRIEIGEVETVLAKHPLITNNAVVVKELNSVKQLAAYYISNNQKPTVEQLRNFLKESLPDYMIPAVFIEVTEFPLTPNGKLNRKALSLKPVEVTSTEAITEAVTDVEKRVLAIWRDVLSNNQIGVENTFFEVGGDSISAVYVTEKISHEFNCQVGVTSLFKYPDVKRLANFVSKLQKLPATPTVNSTDPIISVEKSYQLPSYYEESIAVIGISCRFSKAEDQYEFWEKLLAGEEFIDLLSKEVLHKAGLASELINSSHFVPAQSLISGKDLFDADFFNIMPRDAEYMDPQLRFLLLHSWGAVEDAGYCVEKIPSTGVFMTASNSFYHALLPNIAPQSKKVLTKPSEYVAWVLAQGGTIPTMISYRLGLKGPSFFVHSNCSSSLVGLHVARQSLLSGECDYALVGAAALSPSTNYGYIYQDGLNFSADGHVKTFDNSADGMVGGEGVAVILMKRAVDAIRDGDNIYALLRSTAINNDGSDKVGFYAPSVSGQANVIEQALQSSGVAPSSICYVEAHGTGTRLGDPIEIAALSEVYTKQTDREQYCGVGSVKTNLGHLDAAAGLAGIVKLSLSLKNGVIPPSINYLQENQEIKFENTPFYVVDKVVNFPERAEPIRAAISSFGLGGTNTHAIFEQYKESRQTSKNGLHLVPLSAKSSDRLIAYADKLLQFLRKKKDLSIADIAYTLQIGRKAMSSRVAFLANSVDSLIKDLQTYCQSLPSSTAIIADQTEARKVFDKVQNNSNILNVWYQEKDLSSIAKAWVTGIDIDWSKFSVGGCRISLPTYPFAQEKFWAPGVFGNLLNEDGRLQPASATSSLHPLVHRNTSDLTEQRFSSSLSGKEFFLADHLILGKPTLPAVAYLEMAYTAVTFAIRGFNPTKQLVKIKNTVWSRPLTVSSRPVEVHIALTPDVDGQITYKIYQGDEEQVHSIGTVEVIEKLPAPQQNLNQLSEKCSLVKLSGSDCYAAFKSAGVDYGSGHQGLSSISIGSDNDGEHIALAKLTLPKSVSDTAGLFQLHPSLLDSALQVSIVLQSQSSGLDMTLPYSLGSVILYEHCPSSAWVVVKTKGGNNRRVLSHDIDICDESGRVCIRLEDFVSRRVDVAPSQSLEHQTLLFVPEWVKSSALSKIDTYDRFLILCGIEKEGISFTEEKLISLTSNETLLHRQFTDYALQLKQCLNSLMKARLKPTLVQVVVSNSILSGLAGLLKSARQENPSLLTQLIEIRETLSRVLLQEIIDENSKTTDDLHVLYEGGERKTLRWIEREFDRNTSTKFWRNDGIYLITGGAGEIGLKVASEIITSTHLARVVLVGRSSSEEKVATRLQHIDAKRVEYIRANVAEREEVEKLLSTVKEKYGDLHGIIHSAGLIRDSYLAYKSDEEFIEVLTPKVNGLFWLDELSQEFSLELFILFSSISGIFGNAGQADYAAANAFCDAYAHYRMTLVEAGKRRGKTVSIDWPLWKMGGMQIPEQIAKVLAKEKGLVVLPDDEGLGTLYDALDSGSPQLLVLHGEVAKIRTALESSVSEQKEQVMTVSAQEQHVAFSRDEDLTSLVINYLKGTVSEAIRLSSDKIDAKASFETFGIDSIMITELTSILEKQFGSLPKTLFFEYQNLQELAQYFVDSHTQKVREIFAPVPRSTNESNKDVAKQALVKNASSVNKRFVVEPGKSSKLQGQKADRKDIAIIGISGRYPKAGNLEEFWENLRQGRDCITEIPKERWDHSLYFDEDKNKFGKTYSKWGGFVDDVDKFDAMFFNISPREAEYMDPQERLFMEAVYEAIEDAGYTRENLASRKEAGLSGNVGVFAGMMYEEYQLYGAQETLLGRPIALSGSPASIANRVSYFCNFHGPSVAVDTMCSSSLTAIHFACLSLQEGDCEVAIAGGVNVSIHPNKYLMLGQGKFVSSKGRCESFGLGGDGYVPAEGVGVVLLKPLERAIEDGDQIYAVIKGTSINHGGKVSGYSVPNPNAQAAVIQKAIERAGIHPETISYIEAHGTGTVLGDPIEIASLTKCFSQYTSRKQFCAIGSVKSNVGHCESAAGVCGLTKVLLQMKYKQLVPSLHSELLNPNIDFTSSPFVVQQSLTEWKRPVVNLDGIEKEYPRRAGISSFGAGGANAHIILEEYISEPINFSDTSPAILLLSTKSESQLRRAAERLLKTLNSNSYEEKDLHSICYTLQVGREAMDYRLAIVATSIEQIKESLTAFLTNQKNFQDLYTGHAKSNQDLLSMFNSDDDMTQTIEAWLLKGKYSKVCQYWVKGGVVNWNLLYQDKKVRRLSLPSYPFEKERFWVPVVEQQPIYSTNVYQSATNGHTKALDREFYEKLLDELILDQITVDQATKQVLNAVKKQ